MRLVFFFFFIISALVAQDVREEADYSFNISKTSVLKIYGEIDVIIENWQKMRFPSIRSSTSDNAA
jgi:hypothetical protein